MSEQGVLHSKSESKDSTWVKIGGPGFETKVVDNILWLRSKANMVGYLNAPDPFDEDGCMCTGDEVEVKGEYLRFLGRQSEVINVGGKKVFPGDESSPVVSLDLPVGVYPLLFRVESKSRKIGLSCELVEIEGAKGRAQFVLGR